MILHGFVAVVISLGQRVKPYRPQICNTIKLCLDNKSCKVRQKAAYDYAISQIAVIFIQYEEEQLLGHLGVGLYEYLAEECPDVLGSILVALKPILHVGNTTRTTLPVKNLLQRLTPIKKIQPGMVRENCIELVCQILPLFEINKNK